MAEPVAVLDAERRVNRRVATVIHHGRKLVDSRQAPVRIAAQDEMFGLAGKAGFRQ